MRTTAAAIMLVTALAGPLQADDSKENAATHYRKAFALLPKLSAEEERLMDELRTGRLGEAAGGAAVAALLKRVEPALEELRRAAASKRCEWGLKLADSFDAVSDAILSASKLVDLAVLQASRHFIMGNEKAAVDALAAALRLGRHISALRLYIANLVSVATNYRVFDAAAVHLPDLKRETLRSFLASLESLPKAATFAEAVIEEKYYLDKLRASVRKVRQGDLEAARKALKEAFLDEEDVKTVMDAAGNSVNGLLKLIDETDPVFEEMSKMAALPLEECKAAFQKRRKTLNPLALKFFTNFDRFREAEARAEIRFALFRAAVAVAADGPDEVKKYRDPYGDGPFDYRKLEGGFELRSKQNDFITGNPITLTVGRQNKR